MLIKNGRIGLLGFLTALILVFCIQFVSPGQIFGKQKTEPMLFVAAAASLQDVLKQINSLYTQANPNRTISFNFAASGVLQQQIEQGAPFDIFISAADQQMNALQKKLPPSNHLSR